MCSGRATSERLHLSMESFDSAPITTSLPSARFVLFVASIVFSRARSRWQANAKVCVRARAVCVCLAHRPMHTSTRTLSDRFVLLSVRERYQPYSSVTGVLVSSLLFCILLYGRAFVIPPFVTDSFSQFFYSDLVTLHLTIKRNAKSWMKISIQDLGRAFPSTRSVQRELQV